MEQLSQVFALIAGVIVIFGPLATGLTKLVDMVRWWDTDDSVPKIVWILLAWGLALVVCLVFELNVMAQVLALIPRLSDSTILDGVWGQIITAAGMAGMASYQHERMDRNSAEAKALKATVPVNLQS